MEKGALKKVERFEVHHRILAFSAILVGTIIFTRLLVVFYNPNPILLHLEIHHFDYGILLILISTKLLLFGPKRYDYIYLFLTAIASGLIIDEYWFIRRSVVENTNQTQLYNSTFPSVLILVLVGILTVFFINSTRKSRLRKHNN